MKIDDVIAEATEDFDVDSLSTLSDLISNLDSSIDISFCNLDDLWTAITDEIDRRGKKSDDYEYDNYDDDEDSENDLNYVYDNSDDD